MSTAIYTEAELRELPFDLLSDELIEQEIEEFMEMLPQLGITARYGEDYPGVNCTCNNTSGMAPENCGSHCEWKNPPVGTYV